jgi:hypothetical protein
VLFRSGHQKDAEDASRQALAQHSPEPMLLYHAGMIAMAGGNTEAGKELFKQALGLNPAFAFPQAQDAKSIVVKK